MLLYQHFNDKNKKFKKRNIYSIKCVDYYIITCIIKFVSYESVTNKKGSELNAC